MLRNITMENEENRQRLVCVVMGQNCERFLPMCLESVKDADKIVYCDGDKPKAEPNKSMQIALNYGCVVISNEYNQEDKGMNGKQRNFYLDFIKELYPDYWCIVLDADEVVDDLSKIKDFIQVAIPGLYSPKMRHFIGDLGHEDAITPEHFCLMRLFKISEADKYPEVEHPVLQPKESMGDRINPFRATTIWHLAYMPGMWEIKKRYENHMKKSNMHTPEFLKNWYYAHLFGQYPKSQIDLKDIPKVILNEFGIDKDEIYFADRGLEPKHFIMTKQWLDGIITEEYKKDVIEFGCGLAPFGVGFINQGWKYEGVELSKFAVEHAFVPIKQGNIINYKVNYPREICLCFDVLEHLNKEELDLALDNIKDCANNFIFSVQVIGDPNLNKDKTHKIKESKEWWIEKLSKHFNIKETPKDWLFANQIIIGERK